MQDAIAPVAPVEAPVRVLLADPDKDVRAMLAEGLRSSGHAFTIAEAGTGAEALTILRSGKVEMVFIDVQMSNMSGIDAVREARREGQKPFLILTAGMVLPNWAVVSTELFAYEFLKKPIANEDIANALRAHLRMRRPTRFLIADSSPHARSVVRKIITASRFATDIDETDNGAHALKMARLKTYDVALVDIALGGMSALEAACQLQARTPDLHVSMMTSGSDPNLANSLRHFGLTSFLNKPFFTRDIEVLLHQVYGLRRPYLLNAVAAMDKKMASVG